MRQCGLWLAGRSGRKEQTGLEQNLKAVADAEDQSTPLMKPAEGIAESVTANLSLK